MNKRARGEKSPIEILCSHGDKNTRQSAAEYLAEKGSPDDLPLVEKLRTDADSDVRSHAEIARNSILLRQNASQFFGSFVLTSPWVSEDNLATIQQRVAEVEADLLKRALAHADTKVQVLAAKELVARSLISVEEIKALKDGEGICEVLRVYYLNAIDAGHRFQPKEIRDALKPTGLGIGLFDHKQVDADAVIAELFKRYAYEELLAVASWESADSPIAYRVLAEKHFAKFGQTVRADLKSDFTALKAKLKAAEQSASGLLNWSLLAAMSGSWQPDVSDFAAIALSALAMNGDARDREIILPFLEHKSVRVRVAALAALRRAGTPQDTALALRIADETDKQVSVEAAKTALALSPGDTGSASTLLRSGNAELVRLAIHSLLSCDPKKVWRQVEGRLHDEGEEIRKVICAYAIKNFAPQRLAKLLDTYTAEERYFYNVVFFLDRAIYAKPPLRKLFIDEIQAFLD